MKKIEIMMGIYLASDGSMMSQEDVIEMLRYYLDKQDFVNCNFDEITVNETEFTSKCEYEQLKSIFEWMKIGKNFM